MTSVIALIDGGGDLSQRDILRKAFDLIFPRPNIEQEPKWAGPGTLRQPLYHHWYMRKDKFEKMLMAEAYESASLLLMPEGENWAMFSNDRPTPALSLALACLSHYRNQETASDDPDS